MGKKILIPIIILVVSVIAIFAFKAYVENKPISIFQDLRSEDIVSVSIEYGSYTNYKISDEDKNKFVEYLNKIYVYKFKDKYVGKKMVGLSCTSFALEMKDGDEKYVYFYGDKLNFEGKDYSWNGEFIKDIEEIYYSYTDIIRATSKPITRWNVMSYINTKGIVSIDILDKENNKYMVLQEDKDKLLEYLEEVEVWKSGMYESANYVDINEDIDYDFVLHMKDGEEIYIATSREIFIIDGKGYNCDSEVCDDIREIYDSYVKR